MIRIEIEGVDAAGKSTAVNRLAKTLRGLGKKVLRVSEAGLSQSPFCVALKSLILDKNTNASAQSIEYLFAAQRQEVQSFVKLQNDKYDYCISDRGKASHYAYGMAEGVSFDWLDKLFNFGTDPDYVLFLDPPMMVIQARLDYRSTTDRIELKGMAYMKKVRNNYIEFFSHNPEWKVFTDEHDLMDVLTGKF